MSAPWLEVRNLYTKYVKWVSSNPSSLGDVEMTIKWLSYFIAGRINNSSAVSELVYSLSNLLVFYNDRIIEKASGVAQWSDSSPVASWIKIALTTLEYCEVFIELSAYKIWGPSGRWFFIIVVQTFKCIGRLILTLCCQNNNIVKNPPIPVLNRKTINEPRPGNVSFHDLSQTVRLKRSGRVLRKVDGAPPAVARAWKPLKHVIDSYPIQCSGRFVRTAELIYILKPLVHLACVRKYGLKSWKSYLVPMAIDLASLRIYYMNREDLSTEQKQELSRRCVSMLLYLMRSPFYDKFSKDKIAALLNKVGNNIPLTGVLTKLVLSYIPHWQETYFYMWST
ncbi:peroxisomal membrane protein PEX16 [Toxorhynchites rutilus septentrionalis]|uniref:peroxisomal membrane protein PEX16 n=1 Tax=Toxorhynchites rutilus septentrionalis TaxID=329112 RepID=UPI002479978B|nr:peroxisomal membrane protein PEX16 [Toxorhynchites rutilus septentrionalis]